MDNNPATTCSGTFFDSGGPVGNYANGEALNKTFTSLGGQRLRIKFSQFSVSAGDQLYVYDGSTFTAPLLRTLGSSGLANDSVLESSGASLTILWNSNASGNSAGWSGNISCFGVATPEFSMAQGQTITACSGVYFDPGGATGGFGDNVKINQTICSSTGERLLFNFSFFQLWQNDTLYVYDGDSTADPLLHTYTYGSVVQPFVSPNSCVTFRLVSDATFPNLNGGWRATFSCTNTDPFSNQVFNMSNGLRSVGCSGTFYDQGGTGAYNESINPYTQTFRSVNGSRLRFQFGTAFMEQGSDYLYIYDGPNRSYPYLGRFTGSSLAGKTLESTGDAITFHFVGNGGNMGPSGWVANFSCTTPAYPEYTMSNSTVQACTGRFFDAGGPMANNPEGSEFTQSFCAQAGKRLVFSFLPQVFESPITYIGSPDLGVGDSLFVYDGPSTSSPVKAIQTSGNYMDGYLSFEKIVSSGACITFRLKKSPGSQVNWWSSFSCEDFPEPEVFLGKTGVRYVQAGTFTDDGGPTGNYLNDIFNFTGGTTVFRPSIPGTKVQVSFSQFSSESQRDVLSVYDGNQLIGSYSGNAAPGLITANNGELRFVWVTDASDVFSGWKADLGLLGSVPIVGTLGAASYCAGSQLIFPFTSPQAATDNVFTAELSDANGSFANPVVVGTAPGVQGGSFLANLPNNLTTSGQYRIRINSSNPAWTGIASLPFGIRSAAPQPAVIQGKDTVCAGSQSISYTIAADPLISSYTWVAPVGATIQSGQGTNSVTMSWSGSGLKTLSVSGTNACGAGPARTLDVLVNPTGTLFATIDSPVPATLCQGQNANFASTVPANAVLQYQWQVNGVDVAGDTLPVFIATNIQANFNIRLRVTAGAEACFTSSTATSNTLNYTVLPPVPVSADISLNNPQLCQGQAAQFTSNLANGGSNPSYAWFVNGNAVAGATQPFFSPTNLQNGDKVHLVVGSSAACATPVSAESDTVTVSVNPTVNPSVSVSSSSGASSVCQGESLTLVANPTQPGTNPQYQWFQNGNAVFGAMGASFSTPNSLSSNAIYFVQMTSYALCASPQQVSSANFSVAVTVVGASFNSGGIPLTFSATPANGQTYQWFLDGQAIVGATSNTFQPSQNGNYSVRIVLDGCADTSAAQFVTVVSNRAEIEQPTWKVYPNPAGGKVWVHGNQPGTIRLLDALGKTLLVQPHGGHVDSVLELGGIPPGLYWIRLEGNAGSTLEKVRVEP